MKIHNEGSNVLVTFTRSVDDLPQRFVLTSGTTYIGKYVVEFINLLCRTTNTNLSVELESKEAESFVCVRGNNMEKCECLRSGKIKISKNESETVPVRHSYTYKDTESKQENTLGDSNNSIQNNIQHVNTESETIETQSNTEETTTINTPQKRKRTRKDEDKV
ncbi:MAG: hypothetical protein QXF12_01910 [Candidatus Aenigmatarchaeota archaeon]